jgi:hypothetical protein
VTLTSRSGIPWYLWCAALAVTSAFVGGYWDIAWHRSIGRDSFWSAPHMAIYACGILAGISAGYLIFSTTFGKNPELKAVSVRIWGLSGPLGAFICAWGGVAMLASAPFDDWWHNAYGLDVRIISPPHMVLAAGFFGIELGTVMLMLAFMNRAHASLRPALERLFLYVGGTVLCESLLIKMESISRSDQHNARFYFVVLIGTPAILTMLSIASNRKWASTIIAAVYSAFTLAFLWILPLFPAEPKLGPVFREVTHFIPWEFPLLLIVPAFVMDLIMQRTHAWRPLVRALVVGLAFFAVFVAVQWPFADFMLSPAARNWFFGGHYLDFATPPRSPLVTFEHFYREPTPMLFWRGMLFAALMAWFMAWIGMHAGRAMQKVRR